jgi:hypothetical protein
MSLVLGYAMMAVLLQGKKAPTPGYVGDWVTIQASDSDGHEALHLAKDGTFVLRLSVAKQPDKLAKGHYTVKAELPPGTQDPNDCSVYLLVDILDGKLVAKDAAPPQKLGFYSKGPILTDTVAVIFCHKGDQARITKMFSSGSAGSGKAGG